MARGLKFWIWKAEGLFYPSGENKGADQLRGHREADLRLCFRICENPVFSRRGSIMSSEFPTSSIKLRRSWKRFDIENYRESTS